MRGAFFESTIYGNDGTAASFRYRKALAILFYVMAEKRRVARKEFEALLWPDADEAKAKNAFRVALSDIRQSVGDVLETNRQNVTLNDGYAMESDLEAFDAWAQHGASNGVPTDVPFTTPILSSLKFDDAPEFIEWIDTLQERVTRTGLDALIRMSDAALREGRDEAAIAALRDAVTLRSWDESTHRRLIRLLATLGRLDEAEQQIETCKREVRRHFDEAPSQALSDLADAVATRSTAESSLPPAPVTPHGILGHARDVLSVEQAFTNDGARVVILTGIPGVGTSTIAWAAARVIAPRFLGRVTTWSAADVTNEADFATQLASVSKHEDSAPRLVLVDDVANLAWLQDTLPSLTQQHPQTHFLIAGRGAADAKLGVTLKVAGLPVPREGARDPNAVATTLALRAMNEAGGKASDALRDDPRLARLVRCTGGHPLTLLLLGALLARYGLAEVDAHFEALLTREATQPAPDLPSLDSTFTPALDLLPEEARATLAALAVFHGPFEQGVARRITGIDDSRLVRDLRTLQRHHWIESVAGEGGTAALQVVASAGLHLRSQGRSLEPILDAHADWISDVVERAHGDVLRHDQQRTFALMEGLLDDVDAALDHLEDQDRGEDAIRLASNAWRFHDMANRIDYALTRLSRLLDAYGTSCDPLVRSDALHARGSLLLKLGRLDEARAAYEAGLALRTNAGDVNRIASSLNNLAVIDGMSGAFDDAAARFLEVYERADEAGEGWIAAAALVNRGHALTEAGHEEPALETYRLGAGRMKALGDHHGQLGALLGVIHTAAACRKDGVVTSAVVEWTREMGDPGSVRDVARLDLPARVAAEKLRTFGYPDLAPKLERTVDAHLARRGA